MILDGYTADRRPRKWITGPDGAEAEGVSK